MTALTTKDEAPRKLSERESVEQWRAGVLREAGLSYDAASLIGKRTDIDLHRTVLLIEQGCTEALLLGILL
jgi:hypothetical protein